MQHGSQVCFISTQHEVDGNPLWIPRCVWKTLARCLFTLQALSSSLSTRFWGTELLLEVKWGSFSSAQSRACKSNTEFCRIHMSVYDSEVYLYLYMFLFCFQDHHHGRLHDGPAQIPAGRAELHLGNRELWVMLSYMISTSRQRPWRLDAHAESEALGLMERLKTLNSRRTRRRAVAVNLLHLSLEFSRVWKVVVALRLQI